MNGGKTGTERHSLRGSLIGERGQKEGGGVTKMLTGSYISSKEKERV